MIKEVLANNFERHIWGRYIRDLSFNPSVETLYATALGNLNKNETEKTISYIVLTLDADSKFEPVHHLAKILLFSLSDEFIKKKGPSIKQTYHDLNKQVFLLEQALTRMEKERVHSQNNLSKIEAKLNEGFSISSILKKKENLHQLTATKDEIIKISDEIDRTKKDIKKLIEIAKIEEYIKVISVILEAVNFPKKFYYSGRNINTHLT